MTACGYRQTLTPPRPDDRLPLGNGHHDLHYSSPFLGRAGIPENRHPSEIRLRLGSGMPRRAARGVRSGTAAAQEIA